MCSINGGFYYCSPSLDPNNVLARSTQSSSETAHRTLLKGGGENRVSFRIGVLPPFTEFSWC